MADQQSERHSIGGGFVPPPPPPVGSFPPPPPPLIDDEKEEEDRRGGDAGMGGLDRAEYQVSLPPPPPPPDESPPSSGAEFGMDPKLPSIVQFSKHNLVFLENYQILVCAHCYKSFTSIDAWRKHSVKNGGCPAHPLAVAESNLRRESVLALHISFQPEEEKEEYNRIGTRGTWIMNSLFQQLHTPWIVVREHMVWSTKSSSQFDTFWKQMFGLGSAVRIQTDEVWQTRAILCELITDCAVLLIDSDMFTEVVYGSDELGSIGSGGGRYGLDSSSEEKEESEEESEDISDDEWMIDNGDWQEICALILEMSGAHSVSLKNVAFDVFDFVESCFEHSISKHSDLTTEWFECELAQWLRQINHVFEFENLHWSRILNGTIIDTDGTAAQSMMIAAMIANNTLDPACMCEVMSEMKWCRIPFCLRPFLLVRCAEEVCFRVSSSSSSSSMLVGIKNRWTYLPRWKRSNLISKMSRLLRIPKLICDRALSHFSCLFYLSLDLSLKQWIMISVIKPMQNYLTDQWYLIPPSSRAMEKVLRYLGLLQLLDDINGDESGPKWSYDQRYLFSEISWFVLTVYFAEGMRGVVIALSSLVISCVIREMKYHPLRCGWHQWGRVLSLARGLTYQLCSSDDHLSAQRMDSKSRKGLRKYIDRCLFPELNDKIEKIFLSK